jgi:hypothetical protein
VSNARVLHVAVVQVVSDACEQSTPCCNRLSVYCDCCVPVAFFVVPPSLTAYSCVPSMLDTDV